MPKCKISRKTFKTLFKKISKKQKYACNTTLPKLKEDLSISDMVEQANKTLRKIYLIPR